MLALRRFRGSLSWSTVVLHLRNRSIMIYILGCPDFTLGKFVKERALLENQQSH